MYVSSNISMKFHKDTCPNAKNIDKSRIEYGHKPNELTEKGYVLAKCCSKSWEKYSLEKDEIDEFCKENHIKVWFEDNSIYIETEVASWKLVDESNKGLYTLYHSNTEVYSNLKKENGKIIHNYHIQKNVCRKTIIGYIKYIINHDIWRVNELEKYKTMPKTTKNQRKKYRKAKKESRKTKIRNVLNMLESLRMEEEYKRGKK